MGQGPRASAALFLLIPLRRKSGLPSGKHLLATPPLLRFAQKGRKLADAVGRPAALLPGSRFLELLTPAFVRDAMMALLGYLQLFIFCCAVMNQKKSRKYWISVIGI